VSGWSSWGKQANAAPSMLGKDGCRCEKRKVKNKLYITRGNGSITTNPHSPPPLQSTQDVHSSDFIILVPLLVLALVLLLVIIPKGHARSPTSTATTTCTGGTREAGGGGSC
jgi:hypothetical protein